MRKKEIAAAGSFAPNDMFTNECHTCLARVFSENTRKTDRGRIDKYAFLIKYAVCVI